MSLPLMPNQVPLVLLEWMEGHSAEFMVVDTNGRLIFANEATSSWLGMEGNDLLSLCLKDIDQTLATEWLVRGNPRWNHGVETVWQTPTYVAPEGPPAKDFLLKAISHRNERFLVLAAKCAAVDSDLVKEHNRTLSFVQGVIDAFPDFLFEGSVEGRYLNTWTKNPELLAASREFLIGHTLDEVLSPESAAIAKEAFREANEQGLSFGKVISVDTELGRHWFELSVSKMSMGEGQEPHFITVSRDVTARLSLQMALADKERQFRTLVENSPDLIARFDPAMRCLYANPAFAARTQLLAAELVGTSPSQALGVEAGDPLFLQLTTAFRTGEPNQAELDWIDAHGRHVICHASMTPERDDQGRVNSILFVGRDIHELRAYQDRIHRLVESNIIGVLFWTAEGAITEANDAILQLLGYSRYDLIGGVLSRDKLTPVGHEYVDAHAVEQVRSSGTCQPYEKELLHRDGRRIPVLVGSTILDRERQIGVTYVLDLTEQRRAEAEHRARESAEAASRAKSEFLARMSHEIRTPLNAVLGLAYLVGRETQEDMTHERMQLISGAGRSLLRLINDILDHTKIEEGLLKIESAPFDLQQVLDNVAVIMGAAMPSSQVELIVESIPKDKRHFVGDAMRLEQVLINLASNSLKFTHRGFVALSVQIAEQGPESVHVRFSVEDTGIGIAPDEVGRLFNPFVQADPSTTRRYGGTGLGLSICKRLVKLMSGEIGVDSLPGKGSTFWFSLPLGRTATQDSDARRFAAKIRLNIHSARTKESLLRTCEHLGWEASVVDSGVKGATGTTARDVDATITEWPTEALPDLGALISLLGTSPECESARKIILTGIGDAPSLTTLLEKGQLDAVLTKPVAVSSLVASIRRTNDRSGLPMPAPSVASKCISTPLSGMRVLVVDDSDINRELACSILVSHGAEVVSAAGGHEALDILRDTESRCDIVLMDLHMPRMTGLETTAHIRRLPGSRQTVPVVALTAAAFVDEQRTAMLAGMDAVVTKPFDVDSLVLLLLQLTGRSVVDGSMGMGAPAQRPLPLEAIKATSLIDPIQGIQLWQEASSFHLRLKTFLEEYEGERERLQGLEAEALAERVHKTRGTASALTLIPLAQRAAALESRLRHKEHEPQDVDGYVQMAEKTCDAIRDYLERDRTG